MKIEAKSEEVLMFTDVNTTAAPNPPTGQCRQFLSGLLLIAAPPSMRVAWADTALDATATVERFNMALLAAMKAGRQTDFSYRFQALAPAVDQAFDLSSVLAVLVGRVCRRISKAGCWTRSAATWWPATWPTSTITPARPSPICPKYEPRCPPGRREELHPARQRRCNRA